MSVPGHISTDEVMSGGESSLELKRLARATAWANDSGPDETEHHVCLGEAREIREPSDQVHFVVTSPPYIGRGAHRPMQSRQMRSSCTALKRRSSDRVP